MSAESWGGDLHTFMRRIPYGTDGNWAHAVLNAYRQRIGREIVEWIGSGQAWDEYRSGEPKGMSFADWHLAEIERRAK